MSITLEQFKALKPGDVVRIRKIDSGRPDHWNSGGGMDKYAGQIVTIKKIFNEEGRFWIKQEPVWNWWRSDIDGVIVNKWPKENLHITISSRRSGKQDWIDDAKAIINSIYGRSVFDEKPLIQIDKVIFNDPATIVFWKDGTKTVVKAGPDEYFDKEKGLAMAISKKVLGNKGNYFNTFKKHDAINKDEEVYVPLKLLKECTTLKKLKALIALMEG